MIQSFVITLREGLEAFLIVAISLAYLRKAGRHELIPAVRWGIVLSILISIGAAFVFQRTARHVKQDIEGHLKSSALKTGTGAFLGVLAFTMLMITREGMETAMLMGTLMFQVKSASIITGAVVGTLSAAFVAWLWTRYGYRVNLAL